MRWGLPVLVLLGAGCGSVSPEEPTPCSKELHASVMVRIEDPDGDPVPEASVVATVGGTETTCELYAEGMAACFTTEAGRHDIRVQATGFVERRISVEVERGPCQPATEQLVVVLDRVDCPDELVYGVEVQAVDAAGDPVGDAKVEWLPLDGMDYTSPMPCDGADPFLCAPDTSGEVEIWATARSAGGFYTTLVVPEGDCGPVSQPLTAVLTR